jgi:hypothetical protein
VTTPAPSPPPSADLRASVGPVRDQGDQRGTCLAFAVTAAHEAARGGTPPDHLSEEALYWGCKRVDSHWRSGTHFASAAVALPRWGQPLEAVWPYEPTRKDTVAYRPPSPPNAGWFKSGLRSVANGPNDVRAILDGGLPVLIGLRVFRTLFLPDKDGRVADPPSGAKSLGRHAVLVVGHGASELLIRNSWGRTWGLDGYGWISDAYVRAYAREAWVIDATAGGGATNSTPRSRTSDGEAYGTR